MTYKLTVETDTDVTEYENVASYYSFGLGARWLVLRFVDGSSTQIRIGVIRSVDIEVQR